jgi:Phage tail-collar fibre protein
MSIQTELKATGSLVIKLLDETGHLKDERIVKNIVVSIGKQWITGRMAGNTPTLMSHMAVGTSGNNLDASNTQLAQEVGRATVTTTTSTNNIIYSSTFAPGVGTGILIEAGVFNASGTNAGTMLCRTVFSAINKLAADTLLVEWKVTIN